jgi:hypothetical protein
MPDLRNGAAPVPDRNLASAASSRGTLRGVDLTAHEAAATVDCAAAECPLEGAVLDVVVNFLDVSTSAQSRRPPTEEAR